MKKIINDMYIYVLISIGICIYYILFQKYKCFLSTHARTHTHVCVSLARIESSLTIFILCQLPTK